MDSCHLLSDIAFARHDAGPKDEAVRAVCDLFESVARQKLRKRNEQKHRDL